MGSSVVSDLEREQVTKVTKEWTVAVAAGGRQEQNQPRISRRTRIRRETLLKAAARPWIGNTDAVATAVGRMIVTAFVVDGAEQLQDVKLLAAANVFIQRGSHRVLPGRVAAYATGLFDQLVVDCRELVGMV